MQSCSMKVVMYFNCYLGSLHAYALRAIFFCYKILKGLVLKCARFLANQRSTANMVTMCCHPTITAPNPEVSKAFIPDGAAVCEQALGIPQLPAPDLPGNLWTKIGSHLSARQFAELRTMCRALDEAEYTYAAFQPGAALASLKHGETGRSIFLYIGGFHGQIDILLDRVCGCKGLKNFTLLANRRVDVSSAKGCLM